MTNTLKVGAIAPDFKAQAYEAGKFKDVSLRDYPRQMGLPVSSIPWISPSFARLRSSLSRSMKPVPRARLPSRRRQHR